MRVLSYRHESSVEHQQGAFDCKIVGSARAAAHESIADAILAKDTNRVLELARKDISLFLERLPAFDPVASVPSVRWERFNGQYRTWLGACLSDDNGLNAAMAPVVRYALERGVHPDDQAAFGDMPVVRSYHWRTWPELLRVALDAGAALDMAPAWGDKQPVSVLGLVVDELGCRQGGVADEATEKRVRALIESANLLLDRGARVKDMSPAQPDARGEFSGRTGLLAKLSRSWAGRFDWQDEAMRALLKRLHEAGASLDVKGGAKNLPPVVEALRDWNVTLAVILVELGANVEDDYIARKEGEPGGLVHPFLEEARVRCGDVAVAHLVEALMYRVMREGGPRAEATRDSQAVRAPALRRAHV